MTGARAVDLLAAPAGAPVPGSAVDALRGRMATGLADATAGLPDGAPVELGLPELRRVRYRPDLLGAPDSPFSWKPAFVRRSLGTAAVRACVSGRFREPAEAVGPVADGAVAEWRASGWRTFHWEPWFAGLGTGGRAAVLAEAVTWATPLWVALDGGRLGRRVELGRPDDRVALPGADRVALRGRSEARVAVEGTDGAAGTVLVSVASGRPGDGWPDELAYLALVAALAAPARAVPCRVVGLWPEAGAVESLEVDAAALEGAVDRAVATAAVLVDVRTASESVPA